MSNEFLAMTVIFCSLSMMLALGIFDYVFERRDKTKIARLEKEVEVLRDTNTMLIAQNHAYECDIQEAIRRIDNI